MIKASFSELLASFFSLLIFYPHFSLALEMNKKHSGFNIQHMYFECRQNSSRLQNSKRLLLHRAWHIQQRCTKRAIPQLRGPTVHWAGLLRCNHMAIVKWRGYSGEWALRIFKLSA
jgi:hypothetical protein